MLEFYASPNHPLKEESEDYKYFSSNLGDDFQLLPEIIAYRSAELFNVGFILKIELFQPIDLPDTKMTISAKPSKVYLTNEIITCKIPDNCKELQVDYYHYLYDWELKFEGKKASYLLKATHKSNELDKGLFITINSESNKGGYLALVGSLLWITLAIGLYYSGLGFWIALIVDVITATLVYFIFTKLINAADKNVEAKSEVITFIKKYLVSNFDVSENK